MQTQSVENNYRRLGWIHCGGGLVDGYIVVFGSPSHSLGLVLSLIEPNYE